MIKNPVLKDSKYKGYADGLLAVNVQSLFNDNSVFYKICRIIPKSENKIFTNYIQFLNYKHYKSCGYRWDFLSDTQISESNNENKLIFKSYKEAEEFLNKMIEDTKKKAGSYFNKLTFDNNIKALHFKDCKYLIVKITSTIGLEYENEGLVFNNEINKVEKAEKIFMEGEINDVE